MTESLWLSGRNPATLLDHLRGRPLLTERKVRLLGCGCCRAVWDWFTDDRCRRAVDVAERFADGRASREELAAAEREASFARDLAFGPESTASRQHRSRQGRATSWAALVLTNAPPWPAWADTVVADVTDVMERLQSARRGAATTTREEQGRLLRCLFGNPFRPVALDPTWLTPTAVGIARGIYDDYAFDRLPILADALQDAGCEQGSILEHCRGGGPHVRGCWVVDLVLGQG